MFILTILKWILILILILLLAVILIAAYILILPFFYEFNGDFDKKSVDFKLHDSLRLYSVRLISHDKKLDFKLAFLFNLIKIDSSARDKQVNSKKKSQKNHNKEKEKDKAKKTEKKDEQKDETEKNKKNESLKRVLKEKETLRVLKYAVKELFKTLARLAPKKFVAKLSFSTGSPDITGIVTGGIALLPFIYKHKSEILPDFIAERAYISGSLMMSGYFQLIYIVIYLVKMICQKQVRRILKTLT